MLSLLKKLFRCTLGFKQLLAISIEKGARISA
jgi:hypothetical protein